MLRKYLPASKLLDVHFIIMDEKMTLQTTEIQNLPTFFHEIFLSLKIKLIILIVSTCVKPCHATALS